MQPAAAFLLSGLLAIGSVIPSDLRAEEAISEGSAKKLRSGPVRLVHHSLVDDAGPFLGLGASYMSALWRCRHDRVRLESDLAFLAANGFNYIRVLSMVGHHQGWEGREIAPVPFVNRRGKQVAAWPDYWEQLRRLVDVAFDRYGLRTQITIFADAQLMPSKQARIEHMRRLLSEVVVGREQKIILIEVANEAWQNGFPGDEGVADLREFSSYLNKRTEVLVAITSNHDWPELGSDKGFRDLYRGGVADIATWHFSRDRRTDDGWQPVHDCWKLGELPGLPPVSSNEPIGPGSSVNAETNPVRLVMAAAFAYAARLPMYVFHCEAGVFGKARFEETQGIDQFRSMLGLLPADLPNWQRNDGKETNAPFTTFAGGQPNRYWPELKSQPVPDGCVKNTGSRKANRFVCLPIGVRAGGVELEARHNLDFTAYDPLTGKSVASATLKRGERTKLKPGSGALIVVGRIVAGVAGAPNESKGGQ
jgi:hypothetical protein